MSKFITVIQFPFIINFQFLFNTNISFEYPHLNCFPLKHQDSLEIMSKSVALALMFDQYKRDLDPSTPIFVLRENSSDFLMHECNAQIDFLSFSSL